MVTHSPPCPPAVLRGGGHVPKPCQGREPPPLAALVVGAAYRRQISEHRGSIPVQVEPCRA